MIRWAALGVPRSILVGEGTDERFALALPPIAATSANVAGAPTAVDLGSLDPALVELVSCAVDRGPLPPEGESTILDLTAWSRADGDGAQVGVLRDTAGRIGQALAVLADAP